MYNGSNMISDHSYSYHFGDLSRDAWLKHYMLSLCSLWSQFSNQNAGA